MKSPRVNLVIDRDKAAAVGLNATQIQNALYDAASARSGRPRSTATRRSTACCSSSIPKYQEHADSLEKLAFKTPRGALVPLESVVDFKETVGPQSINHSGPAAVGVGVVRPAARRLARRRDRARQAGGRSRCCRATITTSFEGSGQGVPGVDEEPRPAALRRHRRRLHRARRAVRELHPPDHDSLGAAVGRPRRAGHAVAVRQRAEHLLVRRPGHADRHREEERDHADRLRARRRAPARQDADRGDLRRLPHPLPPDHDDDDGGAARRRCRSRSASAPAAKRGGRSASRSSAA